MISHVIFQAQILGFPHVSTRVLWVFVLTWVLMGPICGCGTPPSAKLQETSSDCGAVDSVPSCEAWNRRISNDWRLSKGKHPSGFTWLVKIGVWMNWLEDVWSCIFLFPCFLVMRCATNRRSWDAGMRPKTRRFTREVEPGFPSERCWWEKEWAEVGNL